MGPTFWVGLVIKLNFDGVWLDVQCTVHTQLCVCLCMYKYMNCIGVSVKIRIEFELAMGGAYYNEVYWTCVCVCVCT